MKKLVSAYQETMLYMYWGEFALVMHILPNTKLFPKMQNLVYKNFLHKLTKINNLLSETNKSIKDEPIRSELQSIKVLSYISLHAHNVMQVNCILRTG